MHGYGSFVYTNFHMNIANKINKQKLSRMGFEPMSTYRIAGKFGKVKFGKLVLTKHLARKSAINTLETGMYFRTHHGDGYHDVK